MPRPRSPALDEICRIIVEEGGYRLAWVSRAERDADKSVVAIARAGLDEGYIASLGLTWADTERGQGATGTAIRTGHFYVIRSIMTDSKLAIIPAMGCCLALALSCGARPAGSENDRGSSPGSSVRPGSAAPSYFAAPGDGKGGISSAARGGSFSMPPACALMPYCAAR